MNELLIQATHLDILIGNHTDLPDTTRNELVDAIINAGWVDVNGRIAQAIIEHAANRMEETINAGDVAETVAFPGGTTGLYEAIEARDSLFEEPAGWLRAYAKKVGGNDGE